MASSYTSGLVVGGPMGLSGSMQNTSIMSDFGQALFRPDINESRYLQSHQPNIGPWAVSPGWNQQHLGSPQMLSPQQLHFVPVMSSRSYEGHGYTTDVVGPGASGLGGTMHRPSQHLTSWQQSPSQYSGGSSGGYLAAQYDFEGMKRLQIQRQQQYLNNLTTAQYPNSMQLGSSTVTSASATALSRSAPMGNHILLPTGIGSQNTPPVGGSMMRTNSGRAEVVSAGSRRGQDTSRPRHHHSSSSSNTVITPEASDSFIDAKPLADEDPFFPVDDIEIEE